MEHRNLFRRSLTEPEPVQCLRVNLDGDSLLRLRHKDALGMELERQDEEAGGKSQEVEGQQRQKQEEVKEGYG
eukprot:460771-Hanusia_phi.AAC.1